MRVLIAATLVASLAATNLLAAEAAKPAAAPLAPGQAAGVKKAQGDNMQGMYISAGILAAVGIVALSSHTGPGVAVSTGTS